MTILKTGQSLARRAAKAERATPRLDATDQAAAGASIQWLAPETGWNVTRLKKTAESKAGHALLTTRLAMLRLTMQAG